MAVRMALVLAMAFGGCVVDAASSAAHPAAGDPVPLTEDATPEQVGRGRRIVEMQCISCHAVRADDQSAPALRTLAERYPVTGLEEAFALGIMTGHPGMPDFRFTRDDIKEILAYLGSIQTRQGARAIRARTAYFPYRRLAWFGLCFLERVEVGGQILELVGFDTQQRHVLVRTVQPDVQRHDRHAWRIGDQFKGRCVGVG